MTACSRPLLQPRLLAASLAAAGVGCVPKDRSDSLKPPARICENQPELVTAVAGAEPAEATDAYWEAEGIIPDMVRKVTWRIDCAASLPADASGADFVLEGAGDHQLDLLRIDGLALTVTGTPCPLTDRPRDLVFAVDVSNSMYLPPLKSPLPGVAPDLPASGNDIRAGDTCGRLKALSALYDSVTAGTDARYGLVTFDDAVRAASTSLAATPAELESSLLAAAGAASIADLVCDGRGGTDFEVALRRASDLVAQDTRADTRREIYLISDGQPDPADHDGVSVANDLKRQGVTIATLMLNGDDALMRGKLASCDYRGNPRHATVEDADRLAAAISDLAANEIVGAQLLYRPKGTVEWTAVDLTPVLADGVYTTGAHAIKTSGISAGLEVVIRTWDRFAQVKEQTGLLTASEAVP